MVKSATATAVKATTKRVRRSPAQARALILDAAKKRLKAVGPEGLQVKEIAAIAGVTHSTILHHFGSAEGLRVALAEHMVEHLLDDILQVMDAHEEFVPDDHSILFKVFGVLSDDGHARLIAWTMLRGADLQTAGAGEEKLKALFARIIEGVAAAVQAAAGDMVVNGDVATKQARFIAYLVATTAVGDGIAGPNLAELIGLSPEEATSEFRDWFADRLI